MTMTINHALARVRGPATGATAALLALLLFDALVTPHFLSLGTLFDIALQVSTSILVALGMTVVIASGAIDLSVGSVMAVASAVAAILLPHGVLVAVLGAIAVALLIGVVNGVLVARLGVLPIIVTLAVLIVGRGIAQVIVSGSALVTFSRPELEVLGKGALGPVPVPVLVAAAAVLVCAVLMRASTFGRYVVAVGGNQRAAELAGVPVARVKVLAYVLSAALAGLAGLVVAARLGATDPGTIGSGSELDAITATVVGGTALAGGRASIPGTVVGSLLLGTLDATFAMHLLPHAWSLFAKASILLAAVYLQRPRAE